MSHDFMIDGFNVRIWESADGTWRHEFFCDREGRATTFSHTGFPDAVVALAAAEESVKQVRKLGCVPLTEREKEKDNDDGR